MDSTLFNSLICESSPNHFGVLNIIILVFSFAKNSDKMNKLALINLCTTFGLKRTGNKPDLSSRLRDFSHQRASWER